MHDTGASAILPSSFHSKAGTTAASPNFYS